MHACKTSPFWLSNIQLRPAIREDLHSLEWNGDLIQFRRLFQQIYHNACQGKAMMWVVDLLGNGVIGQLFVQLESDKVEVTYGKHHAYIYGFRIKPDYQRYGVGSRLLDTVEMDLMEKGFYWINLNVSKQNQNAHRFYEHHGFIVIGEELGRWSYIDHLGFQREVCEPAWRMQKYIE